MPQTLRSLEVEVLSLPARTRARLAKSLLLSLEDGLGAEPVEWEAEAERRYREIKEGRVAGIPHEEVLREARARRK